MTSFDSRDLLPRLWLLIYFCEITVRGLRCDVTHQIVCREAQTVGQRPVRLSVEHSVLYHLARVTVEFIKGNVRHCTSNSTT